MKSVVALNDQSGKSVAFVTISSFGEIGIGLTEKDAASQYDQDVAGELAADLNLRLERHRIHTSVASSINLRRHHFGVSPASPP
jgi:hypothetical protein